MRTSHLTTAYEIRLDELEAEHDGTTCALSSAIAYACDNVRGDDDSIFAATVRDRVITLRHIMCTQFDTLSGVSCMIAPANVHSN